MRKLLVTLLVVGLAACASDPPPKPEPKPEPAPPPMAEVLLDVPLVFFTSEADSVAYPFVEATIRDGKTHLLLDTSMGQHILTRRFAQQVRAPIKESRQVGESGESLVPIEGRIEVAIGDAELDLASVYATEGQEFLDKIDVGGYLSAPHITSKGTTIIDFAGGRLRVVEGPADAVTKWIAEQYPGLSPAVAMKQAGPVVEAAVGERDPVPVLLDTTGETSFEAAYLNDPTPTGTPLADQTLRVGGHQFDDLDVQVMRDIPDVNGQEIVGTIGPEALIDCTLVFDGQMSTVAFTCK